MSLGSRTPVNRTDTDARSFPLRASARLEAFDSCSGTPTVPAFVARFELLSTTRLRFPIFATAVSDSLPGRLTRTGSITLPPRASFAS